MAEITQHIGTIRTLADAPNPLTDEDDDFAKIGFDYTLSQKEVNADMQARVTELNTFAGQANVLASEVNTARDEAIDAKNEAIIARDEAVGAVSTLPDGVINNNTISLIDTWSSQKIDTKKLDKTVDLMFEQLSITAINYSGSDLESVVYTGGYKVIYSYQNGNLYQEKFYDIDQTTLLLTKTYTYTNNNLTGITRS